MLKESAVKKILLSIFSTTVVKGCVGDGLDSILFD